MNIKGGEKMGDKNPKKAPKKKGGKTAQATNATKKK